MPAHRGASGDMDKMIDNYCDGGKNVNFMYRKRYWRPFAVSSDSLELWAIEMCSLLPSADATKLRGDQKALFDFSKGSAEKKLKTLKLDKAKVVAEMQKKPKLFFGMKVMCCSKTSCSTKKFCTHDNADACKGL